MYEAMGGTSRITWPTPFLRSTPMIAASSVSSMIDRTYVVSKQTLSRVLSFFFRFLSLSLYEMNHATRWTEKMMTTNDESGWMVVTAVNEISGSGWWQWSGWWWLWRQREQNVTRTRNSKSLDTRNQQLDTRCNRKFNNAKNKWL